MSRWRQRIDEVGVEKHLQATITAELAVGIITATSADKVILDTTVQPKAVEHPTRARLYRKVHAAMLRIAKQKGIVPRQSSRNQVERLTGRVPNLAFVDRGDKGHGVAEERCRVLSSGTRRLGYTLKRHLRRRSAVESELGHAGHRPEPFWHPHHWESFFKADDLCLMVRQENRWPLLCRDRND